jgi:hypothetical protein
LVFDLFLKKSIGLAREQHSPLLELLAALIPVITSGNRWN